MGPEFHNEVLARVLPNSANALQRRGMQGIHRQACVSSAPAPVGQGG